MLDAGWFFVGAMIGIIVCGILWMIIGGVREDE
jgi:hypothetical protein